MSYRAWVFLAHLLLIGPLLIYVGYTGSQVKTRSEQEKMKPWLITLIVLGSIVVLYHGYSFAKEMTMMNRLSANS